MTPIRLAAWALSYLTLGCLTLLWSGCSSLPGKEETPISERAKQAVDFARLGDNNMAARNYSEALRFYQASLDQDYAIDNVVGIVEAQNSIASVSVALRNFAEATKQYAKALVNADVAGRPELKAKVLVNLAKLKLIQGQTDEAAKTLIEAQLLLKDKDSELGAVIYHNLGVALDRQNKVAEALELFQKALSVNTNKKQLRESAANTYMIASILHRQGKSDEALGLLDKALTLDKSVENPDGIAADLYALYSVNLKLGKKIIAYRFLERSFRVSLQANDLDSVRRDLALLRDLANDNKLTEDAAAWKDMLGQLDKATK